MRIQAVFENFLFFFYLLLILVQDVWTDYERAIFDYTSDNNLVKNIVESIVENFLKISTFCFCTLRFDEISLTCSKKKYNFFYATIYIITFEHSTRIHVFPFIFILFTSLIHACAIIVTHINSIKLSWFKRNSRKINITDEWSFRRSWNKILFLRSWQAVKRDVN